MPRDAMTVISMNSPTLITRGVILMMTESGGGWPPTVYTTTIYNLWVMIYLVYELWYILLHSVCFPTIIYYSFMFSLAVFMTNEKIYI